MGDLTGFLRRTIFPGRFFDDTDTLSAEDVSGRGLPDSEDAPLRENFYGSAHSSLGMSSRMRSSLYANWAALSTGLPAFLGIHSVLGLNHGELSLLLGVFWRHALG